MQSVSMQDLEQFSYWQKKYLTSSHWYLTLMSMSDTLLLQRWITGHGYPMRTYCYVSLQVVEPFPLPLTRCLGVLTNIPVFAFFP